MKIDQFKDFYRGSNLPHWQPVGATFFVTFRLYGSIPQSKIFALKRKFNERWHHLSKQPECGDLDVLQDLEHKRFFKAYDRLLDFPTNGPYYLEQSTVAELVAEQLQRHDGRFYDLICYTIMPNHVHVLFSTELQIPEFVQQHDWETLNFVPLQVIMKRIKGASARYCNLELGRTGRFWQHESYDRVVRNEQEYWNIVDYILQNPVKAKLVARWSEFAHSYYCGHDQ